MEAHIAHPLQSFSDSGPAPEDAEHVDRREHARNVKVMRVARLRDIELHAECLGMVRDVSPGGMMIDALFPMEVGQTISIALLDDQELTGEIVWCDGQTVGVKFAEEIPLNEILAKPAKKLDGQRTRLPRFKAQKMSRVSCESKVYEAELVNISQRGAKLICDTALRLHSNIVIRLDTDRSVGATIKWRSGQMFGAEFHRLLPLTELADWIALD